MPVTPPLWSVLLMVFGIFGAHTLVIAQGWYLTHEWIDIPLHFAGGAWVALAFFYFQRKHVFLFSALPFLFSIILVAGFVMLVGVAWEWFEFGFDFFVAKENFVWRAQLGLPDTMGDLLADLVGGVLTGLYFLLRKRGLSTIL